MKKTKWGQVLLTKENVKEFLKYHPKADVNTIRFSLDALYGTVYTPAQVKKVLKSIEKERREKMKVKVEMIIETVDFSKEEFKKEIEILVNDIDSDSKLLDFDMFEIKEG